MGAMKVKVNAPNEFFDLPKLVAFRANINDLDTGSLQSFLLSLLALPSREFQSDFKFDSIRAKFAMSMCYGLTRQSFFEYQIVQLIFKEIPENIISSQSNLDHVMSRPINSQEPSLFLKALLKEFYSQQAISFTMNKSVNYEQIVLD